MDEKKKGVGVSIDHSEPAFFTDNVTISHSGSKFVVDFSQMTPRFDNFEDKQQQTFVIKHKTVVMDPQFAKVFADILGQNIQKFEKSFGKIKLEKPKKAAKGDMVEKAETTTRYIG
jgi:hypothetical protein